MGLKKVCERVLADLDKVLTDLREGRTNGTGLLASVTVVAATLRGAVACAPDDGQPAPAETKWPPLPDAARAQAMQEALAAKHAAIRAEDSALTLSPCVGGPADGTDALRQQSMGENNYMRLAGHRYQLRGGKLYHDPEPNDGI